MASLTRFKQGQLLQFTGFPRGVPLLKSMFQEPTELNYYLQSTQPETARTFLLDKEFPKVSFSLLPETYHGKKDGCLFPKYYSFPDLDNGLACCVSKMKPILLNFFSLKRNTREALQQTVCHCFPHNNNDPFNSIIKLLLSLISSKSFYTNFLSSRKTLVF